MIISFGLRDKMVNTQFYILCKTKIVIGSTMMNVFFFFTNDKNQFVHKYHSMVLEFCFSGILFEIIFQ